MIKLAFKVAIAGTAIYYVKEQGVWKNSDEAVATANRLKNALKPYVEETKSQIPFDFPEVPETDNLIQTAQEYWNNGVRATFAFLVDAPDLSINYLKKGTNSLKDNPQIRDILNSLSGNNNVNK